MSVSHCKPVINLEKKKIYFSAREAEEQTGVYHSNIAKCCKGKQKTTGGYHWRYATEEEVKSIESY